MTSDDDKTSEYFRALQPVCVRLTKDHSIEAVKLMQNAVKTVPQQYLQYLQSYVLFPLRIILKQSPKKPELIYRSVLQCMEYVLEKTHVDSWEMFQDLFNSLCIMLSSLKNSEEELQLDVVRCLGTMVKQLSISILNQMLSCAFLPSIGHYISLLLGVVQSQCKQTLILAALSCVQRLALSERKNVSKLLRVRAGGILASCFPGVSLAMCKLLTSKDRHGQLVIKSCLDTLTIYVTLVMSDENAESNDTQTTVSQGTDDKLRSLLVERNDTWIESTAAKVQILLKRLGSLSNHDSWKVRIALIKLAESVLTKCQKSLFTSNSCMLEIVVNLINDDYKSVATKSKQVLAQYRSQSSTTEAELNTMLQDNLYDLATKLPRLVRVTDDASKLSTLSLFYGYLNLLGPHLNVMLYSSSHLQRVTLALVQILEFDCSHMHIIEQNPTGKVHDGTEFTQKFYFKHFIDHRILTQIKLILQSLGKHGNIQLLVDHFLEIFHQTEHKKQAIFCINEIVLGTKSDAHKKIEIEDIICSLLEEYIAPTIWNVPTSNIARHSQKPIQQEKYSNNMNQALLSINQQYLYGNNEGHSVQELNSNVILLCLCIDGVDIFAQVLGEDFSNHLMNILYPLMEKLSTPSSYVTQSTYTTLCSICHACKYSDVADLIESNADYLVDAICLRLRHITRHPRSPKVLIIILQYAQCSILKYLNDIIQEILYVVDEHYEDHAVELVQILYALVKAISLWFCSESEDDTAEQHLDLSKLPPQPDNSDDACAQRLVEYFTEYTKLQRESVGDVSEDEKDSKPWEIGQEEPLDGETESSHEKEIEDEKKEPPPQYIDITKQVWERCVHLCSCAEPSVRLTVLKTIHEASTVLYTHQDIYLPLIHKLWPAFVCRFNDSEQLVTIQAIKTAEVLSMTAKDFLYKRICKDVIPKATSLLKKQADISIKAGPAYKYTVAARLQLSTINTLTTMAWKVGLMESPLSDIIAACVPYLNGRQPQYLQQAAVEGFHCLYEANGDMVWFVLNDVFCDTKSSNLIARGGFPYKEYRSNVQLLLDYINDKS